MEIYVNLSVKFRFLGITLGTVSKVYHLPLGIPAPLPPKDLLHVNERGVILDITLQPIQTFL